MRFLRIRQVMQVTGLSRMTIYRLEIAGQFPRRRQTERKRGGVDGVRYRNLGKRPPRRTAAWAQLAGSSEGRQLTRSSHAPMSLCAKAKLSMDDRVSTVNAREQVVKLSVGVQLSRSPNGR
jgi:hypothetical protein